MTTHKQENVYNTRPSSAQHSTLLTKEIMVATGNIHSHHDVVESMPQSPELHKSTMCLSIYSVQPGALQGAT